MNHIFLYNALIYLAAAIVFVPVAKRLGMGSVLGYLIGGIIIGPFCLGFIGEEGKDIMHIAEFGVVMMLFLVGLELEPAHFWRIRRLVLGTGAMQMGLTTLLFLGLFLLLDFTWRTALACGLALSMSSTAIVLQTMREKGLSQTQSGKSSFAALLFQDLTVIPILALLPLLALGTGQLPAGDRATMMGLLPGWAKTLVLLGAVNGVVLAGRYLIVPFLRFIARIHLHELFTAAALFIVIGTAYLMVLVSLSPALGTFLAGVVLANSEYRHELESDIEPFKGILLGLFFISVGASINFQLIMHHPWQILTLVAAIVIIKALVLIVTGKLAGLSFDQNLLFTLSLAQVGEFAFVLFPFMFQLAILPGSWNDLLMGATAISMTVTPLMLLINERFILPRFGTRQALEKVYDDIDLRHSVIIAGYGHFGSTLGRFLRANGIEATILDHDSDRVDLLRKMGFKVFYGDATRLDILKAAGAEKTRILIAAIGSPEINQDLVEKVKSRFPHLTIMARAENRLDAYELMDMGIRDIYRETLDTSVRMGVDVLVKLGFRRYSATRAGQKFLRYDEEAMDKLAPLRHDETSYIFGAREQVQIQEQILLRDREVNPTLNDHAWDSDSFTFEQQNGQLEHPGRGQTDNERMRK